MGGRRLIGKPDVIVIFAVAVVAAVFAFIPGRVKPAAAVCHVLYDGHVVETKNLDTDASFRIKEAPDMVFEINGGKVAVTDSGCPDKVCVKSGFIGRAGQKSVCLPNKVVVSVDGGAPDFDAPDVVTQ